MSTSGWRSAVALLSGVATVALAAACQTTDGDYEPRVLSSFEDTSNRWGKHAGVDFVGNSTILAAAPGVVYSTREPNYDIGCGGRVIIWHMEHGRFTAYCHLSAISVREGDSVRRGQPIGIMGDTGVGDWKVHLHLELSQVPRSHEDGPYPAGSGLEDPMEHIVGCFDPGATYPTDRLVLTHPVTCSKVTWG